MVTGASNADAAVLLLDVQEGPAGADQAAPAHRPPARHPPGGRVREQDGPRRLVARGVRGRARPASGPSPRRSASRRCDIIPGSALRRRHGGRARRVARLVPRPDAARAPGDAACRRRGGRGRPVPLPGAARVAAAGPGTRRAATWAASNPAICSPAPRWCVLPSGRRTRVRQILTHGAQPRARGGRRLGHAGAGRRHRHRARRPDRRPGATRRARRARSTSRWCGSATRRCGRAAATWCSRARAASRARVQRATRAARPQRHRAKRASR